MSDLISRQAAIDAMNACFENKKRTWTRQVTTGEKAIFLDMIGTVNAVPSAEPERKSGKYLKTGDPKWIECSECGMHTRYLKKYNVPNFCPACGADMRGEEEWTK